MADLDPLAPTAAMIPGTFFGVPFDVLMPPPPGAADPPAPRLLRAEPVFLLRDARPVQAVPRFFFFRPGVKPARAVRAVAERLPTADVDYVALEYVTDLKSASPGTGTR